MSHEGPAFPGIYLVCAPQPGRARAEVAAMLQEAGTARAESVIAARGPGWAVAAIAPPADEPTCGAACWTDGQDLLVWTGEMFLPEEWPGAEGDAGTRGRGDAETRQHPVRTAAVVLRQLQAVGVEALAEIDGGFCGAWFDHSRRRWTIFNDRWGLIPLFWTAGNHGDEDDRLVVSPKAWLTWRAGRIPLRINEDGVADLIRTQNMLDDHTLIEGVHWLEPANALVWGREGQHLQRYWEFRHHPLEALSYDDILDRFVEASRRTIARQTSCHPAVAGLLQGISGGLDSRMFLAISHELGRVPACYTSGFAFSDDLRFGRHLARVAGAAHTSLPFDEAALADQLTNLILDTDGLHGAGHLILSTPTISFLAANPGAVLLEGYLHGVLGGSDLPFDADPAEPDPPHDQPWARQFLHSGAPRDLANRLLKPELAEQSDARWKSRVEDRFNRPPRRTSSEVEDPLYRAEYTIITGRSGRNDVLAPALARRHVLVRHPACDRLMIDWYASTPAKLRRARRAYIDVLCRRYPRFARVPRADGCGGLPLVQERWAREYHWQREKLYGAYAWCRYPIVRQWGRDSAGVRAWGFHALRRAGWLDVLTSLDTRILNWVRRPVLLQLWEAACREPRHAVPVLTLATAEVMIRALERLPRLRVDPPGNGPVFRAFDIGSLPAKGVELCLPA